ncbi:MAG: carboxypeptidase-like regulatory domain-containing protein [Acidobacteriia bacterium]|nr:carboxypeptidase-like regulatory domain-containing protein [Terriglobia bacterium]
MLTRSKLFAVVVCSIVLSICPLLYSQANGSFSGTVEDKTGSVISGATVKITSQGTNVTREVKTDGSGHYLAPFLPVSIYTIRVESQGFQTTEQKDIRLQVNEQREVNFTLAPASVSQTVEVSATEVAVETTNPTLGQVITSEQVADLPLNGRDFVQLATLIPGVTQETNPNSFFNNGPSSEVSTRGTYSLSVGGSRAQSTDWLFDGVDNNELTAGGISILPSIDAIQEFKVLTYNYSAEYGTRSGPTVLITTKSGANKFHGSLFEFFRNTSLDAKSFFAVKKEQFNLNQFGGALGGALQKNKTFFFVDYQGTRKRHGEPHNGLIPTQAMMGGDFTQDPLGGTRGQTSYNGFVFPDIVNPYTFSPFQCDDAGVPIRANSDGSQDPGTDCNKIPTNMFDPAVNPSVDPSGLAMIKLYPESNVVNTSALTNYSNVPVRRLNEGQFDIRLDHNFSSKDLAFARFSYDQANVFVPGGSPGFAEQDAFGSTQNISNHGRNVAVSETHIFNDRNINQFTAGFNRIFNHILSIGDRTCQAANIGILGANLNSKCQNAPAGVTDQSTKDCISCGMSSTLMNNYWSLGDRGFAPFQGGTNVFSIADSFDMIRGNHNIKIGMGFRAQQMNVETNAFQDGFYINFGLTGDAAADLLLGQLGGGIHDQTFFGATTGRRWKLFRPFVEDDWRVTKDLTLNIGVAWALTTPVTEAHDRQANFDFVSGKYYVAGSVSVPDCSICVKSDGRVGIQLDKTAFEPRIGLAWKPFGSTTTAVRAGYAIFHDSSWNQGGQGLWENPPYFAESDNFFGPCPFNNSAQTTVLNCGNQFLFLDSNLNAITAPLSPQVFPGALQAQNLNFKKGKVQQFNLNIERQIPGNIVVTAGYAGSRSSHILAGQVNLNVGSPGACGDVAGYTLGCGPGGTAFGPKWGAPTFLFPLTINSNNDVGRAHYDSLQIKAETKSARHGLYALLGYTYSRTFDSGLPDGLGSSPGATYFPLPGYQKLDWGLSQLNLNHQFTASVTYDLPFGKGKQFGSSWSGPVNAILGNWEVDVIERVTSGFPLFVVDSLAINGVNASGVNFQWNGNSFNRPDMVGDPNKGGTVAANPGCDAPAQVHTLEHWFNPCAFTHAAPGELGNSNRAPVYGPRFVNTDLSLIKHFPLPYEGMNLDFRAEFFNAWNHAQFWLAGAGSHHMQDLNAGSSFGVVNTTVKDPRVIQFALKLTF